MSVAPTLPVSEVVNVTIEMSPVAAALRNFGAMLVLGTSDVIDTDERLRTYSGVEGIAADFGTDAPEYQAAVTFFGQSPQPSQLVIGRWAKTATAGLLRGRMLQSLSSRSLTSRKSHPDLSRSKSTVLLSRFPASI